MEYDCTKKLGADLEIYLQPDIAQICSELELHGIVYESQFQTLNSLVCKNNTIALYELFSKITGCPIFFGYDDKTCNFVFYNRNIYSQREAIEKSVTYQNA